MNFEPTKQVLFKLCHCDCVC